MAKKTAEVLTVSRHTAVKILLKSVIRAFVYFAAGGAVRAFAC